MWISNFVRKFTPNYRDKFTELINNPEVRFDDFEQKVNWVHEYLLKEALQNFADKLCEKQRENCSDKAEIGYMSGEPYVKHTSIINAEQPKIEEL